MSSFGKMFGGKASKVFDPLGLNKHLPNKALQFSVNPAATLFARKQEQPAVTTIPVQPQTALATEAQKAMESGKPLAL